MELGNHAAKRSMSNLFQEIRYDGAHPFAKNVSRGTSTLPKHLLPFPSESDFSISNISIGHCSQKLDSTLKSLDLQWQYRPAISTGIGFAQENVWSRAARRKYNQSSNHGEDQRMCEGGEEPALGFKVQLKSGAEGDIGVVVRWLQGKDSVLFESFCGMLKRQLTFT